MPMSLADDKLTLIKSLCPPVLVAFERGGMQVTGGRVVAIKRLKGRHSVRFEQEARAIAESTAYLHTAFVHTV
jgi:hypothetical protein